MWEVKLSGGGSVPSRCEGIVGNFVFLSEPRVGKEREESDKKRGREPLRAEVAAFFVIETVDIVVWAKPERVMSTWLLLPKRIE